MKFKKAEAYERPGVAAIEQLTEGIASAPKVDGWECVGCPTKAAVLHKGTGYCRRCYDKRAYGGDLIN